MSDEFSLRDIAGIWGACLSTHLAVGSVNLPVFHLEPSVDFTADLTIRVANPRRKMIFVREWKRWSIGTTHKPLGVFTDKTKLSEIGEPGKLWIAVKAGDEKLVKVNWHRTREDASEAAWLLVFLWRGAWLLPIELPVFVFISTRLAARI